MDRHLVWARREHSLRLRLLVIALLGPVFLVVVPVAVVRTGRALDVRLGWHRLGAQRARRTATAVLVPSGFALGMAAVRAQVDAGEGTPLPVMPTRRLVTHGPFALSRNPMTLGTVLAYLGVAVGAGSVSAIGVVGVLAAALLLRVRLVEEPELAARFGPAYEEYRRRTPFLLPRLRQERGRGDAGRRRGLSA